MTLDEHIAERQRLNTPPSKTIAEKFEEYHRDNPHVFRLFKQYSEQALDRGYTKFSAKAVFERLRWHYQMETVGDDFKLNNNYTAYYARLLMQSDIRFQNFFELRERGGRVSHD